MKAYGAGRRLKRQWCRLLGTAVGRRDLGEAVEEAGVEWRGQDGSATPVDS